MPIESTDEPTSRKPLRLWPGVVAAVLLLLVRFGLPIIEPEATVYAVLGGLVGALAIVVWWVFFSRVPWSERLGAVVLMIVAIVATRPLTHESIQNGMMGMMFVISAIPTLSLALVVGAAASRRLSEGPRRAAIIAAILLGCGVWTLVRTNGIIGGGSSDLAWRWTETPEERLLAQAGDEPAPLPPVAAAAETPELRLEAPAGNKPAALPPATAVAKTTAAWPSFRGPRRDSIIRGVRIETDWSKSPPVELWRQPIGPGWSSFAVHGDLLYTQEQRGDHEVVACYNLPAASRCGDTATQPGSGSRMAARVRAGHRRSATVAYTHSVRLEF